MKRNIAAKRAMNAPGRFDPDARSGNLLQEKAGFAGESALRRCMCSF